MNNNDRKVLIVDDSEIDREILKTILSDDFEIFEAENGFAAIESITTLHDEIDAILLDISMPIINGFDVLRLLKDNGITQIPIFLITAEATKENIIRAAEFGIADFISKPFDREDILRRMRSRLGISTQYWLTVEDIDQTRQYIDKLEMIYKEYLTNFGKDDKHYRAMTELMKILLGRYSLKHKDEGLDKDKIDIVSRAAYFCDIGFMLVPDRMSSFSRDPEKTKALTQNHTRFGGNIIKLEASKQCAFFVETCSEMCMNHHERYDGYGYPRGISGKTISVYSQMCRLVDEFDSIFSKLYGANDLQVNLVMKQLMRDEGLASPEVMSLFEDCKQGIISYYGQDKKK